METIFSENSKNQNGYVTFFDLDLTLTLSVSGRELAKAAFKNGLLKKSDMIKAIFLSVRFRLNLMDPLRVIDRLTSWVKGINESTFNALCADISEKILLPSVYCEAVSELAYHKSRNARTVILSSALTPVCEKIAGKLVIDDLLCSTLESENGYLTGRPVGRMCYGPEKAVRLTEFCRKNNYSLADAWFYSDSISDITALRTVGNPVCVNPDSALKKVALKEGWKIVRWNSNLLQAVSNREV